MWGLTDVVYPLKHICISVSLNSDMTIPTSKLWLIGGVEAFCPEWGN